MRKEKLAYFQYFLTEKGTSQNIKHQELDELISKQLVDFIPLVYEDFLPVSAAGIFSSNSSKSTEDNFTSSSQIDFENALGQKVLNEFELYQEMEEKSIKLIYNSDLN